MTDAIEATVRTVVAEILGADAASLKPESGARTIPGWDSLNLVRITLALEAKLGVRLGPRDIERLDSFGGIVAAFSQRLKRRG